MNKEFTKGDLKGIRLLLSRIKELAEETNGLSAKDNNRLTLISSSADDLIEVFKAPNEKGEDMNKEYIMYLNITNLDGEVMYDNLIVSPVDMDDLDTFIKSYFDDEASGDRIDETCKYEITQILDENNNELPIPAK